MTYRWIWKIDCPDHKFHCDHYMLSKVQTETRKHCKMTNCLYIDVSDIVRIPAPNDGEY